ncbi:sphingomyelin phosphodiesterase [Mycena galericulata]|nr:sphingomyelin phosphodiesterase [Mycena galericulata]
MYFLTSLILLLPYATATVLQPETVINALRNAVDCDSCHALLVPLKAVAALGDAVFVDTLISTCKVLKLEDEDVCVGAISEQGPILAHALREISAFASTATKLCEGTFGLCQSPAVNKYTVPLPEAGSSSLRKRVASTGKTPFQVVHFSDVHIDREYAPAAGSDANCNKPICCRNFADEAKPPSEPAGPFGNRNCDSPVGLAKSMLEQISAHHTWSIFTGDVVEGSSPLLDNFQREVTNDISLFNRALAAKLNAPVFPAIGTDSAPVNNFPLDATVGFNAQWVFDLEGKEWAVRRNSSRSSLTQYKLCPSTGPTRRLPEKKPIHPYSVTAPGTNLRIISINTVYWYKQNFWLYDSDVPLPDPREILAFTRVWIIGHMPPGSEDTMSDQVRQPCCRHRVGVVWIAPALTPRSGNPSFKIYDVDPTRTRLWTPSVQEVRTLVNLEPTAPLDARFWHRVTEVFEKNDTAFQRYNEFMTRGGDVQLQCGLQEDCSLPNEGCARGE